MYYLRDLRQAVAQFATSSTDYLSIWVRPSNGSTRPLPNLLILIPRGEAQSKDWCSSRIVLQHVSAGASRSVVVNLPKTGRPFVVSDDLLVQGQLDLQEARLHPADLYPSVGRPCEQSPARLTTDASHLDRHSISADVEARSKNLPRQIHAAHFPHCDSGVQGLHPDFPFQGWRGSPRPRSETVHLHPTRQQMHTEIEGDRAPLQALFLEIVEDHRASIIVLRYFAAIPIPRGLVR